MSAKKEVWDERSLTRLAAGFLKKLRVKGGSVDIILLPHARIKALKARFIAKQTEPNVLSFPEPAGFPHPDMKRGRRFLGEIYLNRTIIARNPERTRPLLLHGILHLLGYDHAGDRDAVRMEALERRILGRK
ncbi:MAG TPA: rRNA maturation RNase YbeY [Candidatus Paceibacterota bacterium]|nr:rRNA maturation RNase YbeY [Candidatus Paceibacterota bacterium]